MYFDGMVWAHIQSLPLSSTGLTTYVRTAPLYVHGNPHWLCTRSCYTQLETVHKKCMPLCIYLVVLTEVHE